MNEPTSGIMPGPLALAVSEIMMVPITDKYKTYTVQRAERPRQPTGRRARSLLVASSSFALLLIICSASPWLPVGTGAIMQGVWCRFTVTVIGGCSSWALHVGAASIRIEDLSVFLRTVGMLLERNPHTCVIGKYEHASEHFLRRDCIGTYYCTSCPFTLLVGRGDSAD